MNNFTQWLLRMSLGSFSMALLGSTPALANVLINEDFNNIGDWKDLSTAIRWGDNRGAVSAFTTTNGAVALTDNAFNYTGYTAPNSLKTFTVLDRQFATPIIHKQNVITIDFRARWNSVDQSGSGEAGRFLIVLNHRYPRNGLNLNLDRKYNNFNRAWWARPAYHLRIRAGAIDNTQGTSLLQYGGGFTAAGEYEKYNAESGLGWWLPGFISGAGGTIPGVGNDFPENSWIQTSSGVASTEYRNYRYVIKPRVQEFWFDANNNGSFQSHELMASMPLPKTRNSGGAPLYKYFPKLQGIRLYWRGAGGAAKGQVFLDHLTVTATPAT
ncbi:hypothetical protein IQ266_04160 [filamentous cyanobacterium LEGE 11480]|uniref:Uncharacterized protein n=1 Tax=Romeriopsis navalis LEGE 11480 TaxID=2777977 RepID=A0A928VI05_9CYAN|nr:hypothetical protein [Romeriopsis navalis]MBE9028956.1 hypothetical protein [Romeriopsis navalis LEGE 11480]